MLLSKSLLLSIALVPMLASTASAADFEAQVLLDKQSAQNGLNGASVPLLVRRNGQGVSKVKNALLSKFSEDLLAGGGVLNEERGATHLSAPGKWFVTVREDGTAVDVWSEAKMGEAQNQARAVSSRLSQARLEELGRNFIGSRLSDLIAIGAGEELVPVSTQHLVNDGKSRAGISEPTTVVASRVKFGRRVDGIDVIGSGSIVTVTFDNTGNVIGFSYDWPTYDRHGAVQKTLPVESLRARLGANSKEASGESVAVKRMNCGYYDRGAVGRDTTAPIQPGCSVSYVVSSTDSGGKLRAGIQQTVPAGETFAADAAWEEARELISGGNISRSSNLSKALLPQSQQ